MLHDGLYGLSYRTIEVDEPAVGEALAVLTAGQILGSDPWGGVFSGSCWHDRDRDVSRMHLRLHVPAYGELLTGFAAGPRGADFDIAATFTDPRPTSTAVVEIEGRPIVVELRYIGPIPFTRK